MQKRDFLSAFPPYLLRQGNALIAPVSPDRFAVFHPEQDVNPRTLHAENNQFSARDKSGRQTFALLKTAQRLDPFPILLLNNAFPKGMAEEFLMVFAGLTSLDFMTPPGCAKASL